MSNILTGYLNKRLKDESLSKDNANWMTAGPVITISREVGCSGLPLGRKIAEFLNKKRRSVDWKVLSKEIFYQSAQELNMDPERVRRVFKQSDKYTFEEILNAFSNKNYKSEKRIIKTVTDVVQSFAIEGYTIIVGRAGHIIACNIKNALHIRLTAPLNFRIEEIQKKDGISRIEAISRIEKIEKERISFRKAIHQENLHEELFDLIINRKSFTENEIVELVDLAMEKKDMLERVEAKIQYY